MILDLIRSGNWYHVFVGLLSSLAVIFLTLPVHEYAHGMIANRLGDPTPRYQGRLTLNPLAHIDYIGAVCIILVGFGWAKPVQVNARNFRNPKSGMALVALAGPLANLIMAFVFLLIFHALSLLPVTAFVFYASLFVNYVAQINIYLAVFNLLPVPPLDGSRILAAVLPDRLYWKLMRYERYIYLLIFVLLITRVLSGPLGFLSGYLYRGLDSLAGLLFFWVN